MLIAGPTASGKSALAMEIVARDGRVIVNADALQVYDCWRVLTARPSPADEAALPHRALRPCRARRSPIRSGHWLREVAAVLAAGQRPVIVGGTGLYFSRADRGAGRDPADPARGAGRGRRAAGAREGSRRCWRNSTPRRPRGSTCGTRRGCSARGRCCRRPGGGWPTGRRAPARRCCRWRRPRRWCWSPERDWLDARIDRRFDAMIAAGALEEARAELPDWDPALPSSRAIGAPELVAHLRGEIDAGRGGRGGEDSPRGNMPSASAPGFAAAWRAGSGVAAALSDAVQGCHNAVHGVVLFSLGSQPRACAYDAASA